MKTIFTIFAFLPLFVSCEVNHHIRWEVGNAQQGSERRQKVIGLLKREAGRIGMVRFKEADRELIFSYSDPTHVPQAPIFEARSHHDKVFIDLNTGFDPNILNREPFDVFKAKIDEILASEVQNDFIRTTIE